MSDEGIKNKPHGSSGILTATESFLLRYCVAVRVVLQKAGVDPTPEMVAAWTVTALLGPNDPLENTLYNDVLPVSRSMMEMYETTAK